MSKFDFLDRFNKAEAVGGESVEFKDFATKIGGNVIATEAGNYLETVTSYPDKFLHGVKALRTVLASRTFSLDCFETRCDCGEIDVEDIVFIDAETTGLSAATGTVAFLVGVGFVVEDSFCVHQFFLPDYSDEPALLEAVAEIVRNKNTVVSFNGKAFDLPLLETRYILQRKTTPFVGMRHIDLLHVTRRFWRGRFVDNTLQTLEKELLSVYRYNDTPGYLIPQLFFDFLKSGDAEPLWGVFLHNRLDIVTLLFLMQTVQSYLENAARFNYYSPLDALQIAKHFRRQNRWEAGELAASGQFTGRVDNTSEFSLGLQLLKIQKRLGHYEQALETLRHLRRSRGENRLNAFEETAKILEHKVRNYEEAARVVADAMAYLDNPVLELPENQLVFWNETFQKRRQRLLQRLK